MTKLAADTVAIHCLTVRSGCGAQSSVEALRHNLQNAVWPAAGRDNWIFIRRLHASGAGRQLPQQLIEQTRYSLNQASPSDEVVRFDSSAELLAALLSDLTRGRAGFCWYWRRWAHWFEAPVARALYGVLSENLVLLPSIAAKLAEQGRLPELWLSLDEAGSDQLAIELAGLNGIRLPSLQEMAVVLARPIDGGGYRQTPADQAEPWAVQWHLSPNLLARWRCVLQVLEVSDSRYQLALLLIGQEAAPLLMQHQPARLLAALSTYFCASSPQVGPTHAGEMLAPFAGKSPAEATLRPALSIANPPVQSPDKTVETQPQPAGGRQALYDAKTDSDAVTPAPIRRGTERSAENIGQSSPVPAPQLAVSSVTRAMGSVLESALQPDHTIGAAPFSRFNTAQGGLLYLFNMLNRPALRTLMQQHAEAMPSGWAWLYRLGQELQLMEDDALVDFVALQLSLESRSELSQLPLLPAREQVLNLAQRWYGKTSVWQPDLLVLDAQIQYSPSHIDMYAPMAAIRLPARLAGLDINPGWLPWLGRVVSFHYD